MSKKLNVVGYETNFFCSVREKDNIGRLHRWLVGWSVGCLRKKGDPLYLENIKQTVFAKLIPL